jgi:hypothetical protein
MTKSTLTVSLLLSISLFIGAGCGAPASNDGPAPGDTPSSVDPQKPNPNPSVDGDVCGALPDFSAKLGSCPQGAVVPFDKQSCSATLKACMNSDARKQVADAVQCFSKLPVCDLAAPQIFTIQYADCTLKLGTALTGCGPSVVTLPPLANIRIAGGVDPGYYLLSVPSDGSKADLYGIDDLSGHQRWKIVPSADPKFYNILVFGGVSNDRKYLSTTEDGTLVDLFTEDDGSGRQRWSILPREDGQTYNILISGGVNSGRTFLNASQDGMLVNLHTQDDGSGRQRWSFQPFTGF